MSDALLKTLDEVSPEEFERIKTLAQKRAATYDPLGLSIGMLVGNMAIFVAAFLILRALPIVWTPLLIVIAALCVAIAAFFIWRGAYRKFEKPKELARKQLGALQAELRAREAEKGKVR